MSELKITVAALTHRRPRMVSALIQSLGGIEIPSQCEVRCLIVENDQEERTRSTIEQLLPLGNGLPLDYVLETEPGIPFGRNRAAEEAMREGSDLIAFIDDDETVSRDWLVKLVEAHRTHRCDMVGGPVRLAPPPDGITWLNRIFYDGARRNFEKLEARSNAAEKGRPDTVSTNNSLTDLKIFDPGDVWFDTTMRFTGGTDRQFFRDATAKGFTACWQPEAIVYASIPAERLTFRFQFKEARDRTINRFHLLLANRKHARLRLLVSVPLKCLIALLLLIAVPFTMGRSLVPLARTTGWIAGRVSAAFGNASRLYEETQGH